MKRVLLCSFFCTILLCGCVYHPPVYQGNILTKQSANSIHEGMTVNEVVNKLGSPVLKNIYMDNRMTYVYQTKLPRQKMSAIRLYIDFKYERVTAIREF